MKKYVLSLVSFIVIFSVVFCNIFMTNASSIVGDINGDGRANSSDALIVLRYSVGLSTGIKDMSPGDLNHDGKININRIEVCPDCNGSGAAAGTSPKTCPECHGTGQVTAQQRTPFGVIQTQRACTKCGGKGKIIETPCSKCRGRGRITKQSTLEVNIPAGIDDRQILNVRGEGNKGLNGGPAGDLHVVVNVRPHPFFERDGFDVWCEVHVNLVQATLGDTLMVPTLDGKVKYDIPEGTQPGSVFRLKGKGIQNIRSKARGDQLVRIIVDIPTKLNSEQREALLKFNSLMGGSTPTGEEKKGFFGKKRK